jgi:hypothetical protein
VPGKRWVHTPGPFHAANSRAGSAGRGMQIGNSGALSGGHARRLSPNPAIVQVEVRCRAPTGTSFRVSAGRSVGGLVMAAPPARPVLGTPA